MTPVEGAGAGVPSPIGDFPAHGEFMAGGTDLSERLRSGVSEGPIVDISRRSGLKGIVATEEGGLAIGALVPVADVAAHPEINARYGALAKSAAELATPQIRNQATLGGALCQRTRCWYYRNPHFFCFKRGGLSCPAQDGNNLYGVAFDLGPCVYPHPSSVGLGLLACDATVDTSRHEGWTIGELYGDGSDPYKDNRLEQGELLERVTLPPASLDDRVGHYRLMSRKEAEWPLVECVVRLKLSGGIIALARVCLGAVANIPLRATKAEEVLLGEEPTPDLIRAAAEAAVEGAKPPRQTRYKIPMIVATVRDTLGRALEGS